MATSFDTKYKKNIEGLAKANNVDLSTAGAMLRSNLGGTTSYKGGGVLDFNVANADLKSTQTPQPQTATTSSRPATVSPEQSYMQDIQKAYEARQKAMQEGLTTQLADIKQLSDDNRSQTYVNSRLSAIGNNERLASQGLAGGLYGNPTSGKSESSRIQQDVALGNNLNAVNRQQASLEAQAKNAVATGLADNQMEMAKTIAQLRQQQAQAERAEFTNTIGAYGQDYMQEILNVQNDGDPSNDWKIPYLQSARNQKISGIEQAKAEAEQQAFENQLKLMSAMKSSGGSGGSSSSNYYKGLPEPDMTLPQAIDAFNSGLRTPEVVDAYDYYFGTVYGRDPNALIKAVSTRTTQNQVDSLTGENKLNDKGQPMLIYGGSKTNIDGDLQAYTQAYVEGRITLAKLQEILKKYGYGTDGEKMWITD